MSTEQNKCTLTDNQLIDMCNEWIGKLAKTGGKSWTLSVPVNFNKDPDMLFSELIKRYSSKISPAPAAEQSLQQAAEKAARLQFHPQHSKDAFTACTICFKAGAQWQARQNANKWELALVSLTPGGSEFCGDPGRCVEFVREFKKYQHDLIVKLTIENKQLKAHPTKEMEWLDEGTDPSAGNEKPTDESQTAKNTEEYYDYVEDELIEWPDKGTFTGEGDHRNLSQQGEQC